MVTDRLRSVYDLRDQIVADLRTDLIGPESAEELISDPPITRYVTGILFPQQSGRLAPEHEVGDGDGYDEHAIPDPGVTLAHMRYPASIGITFAVDPAVTERILITIEAARYEPIEAVRTGSPEPTEKWARRPLKIPATELNVDRCGDYPLDLGDGLELFVRVRAIDDSGAVPVTAALVNRRRAKPGLRDADSFFQPSIAVTAPDGSSPFVPRRGRTEKHEDPELDSYRLIYRHVASFAVGHGCAAEWEPTNAADRAHTLRSTLIPQYELPLAMSNPEIETPSLSMLRIVDQPRATTLGDFSMLAARYALWIDGLVTSAADLPEHLRSAADRNIDECRRALGRIRGGIELLRTNNIAWEAFVTANRAMLMQRARADWLRSRSGEPDEGIHHSWYPFQLAFILMCLRGLAEPDGDEREVADLLWFPTGGGKTEAYLGLIAFAIVFRRLREREPGAGVTALMRYTLRLLTLQQFERASILICALEQLRRVEGTLGEDPISIGLWVGRGATPLTRDETRTALNKLRRGAELTESNPVQLHTCPWCGAGLDHANYWLPADKSRLIVSCKNGDCEFGSMGSNALPVFLVDDDIYDYRPSLVIATADKFASLPWRDRAGSLFNLGTPDPPPELIIQDELHLISGPLGTLTGLYETAIDYLCTLGGARPKVVASTATIRRAGRQGQGLFAREVVQFPPSGLDARDSFFAVEASRDDRGTRAYVGVMAPGTSHTSLMVRAYAALLQSAREVPADDSVRDALWTLVGYFNSLRVLGGARMQVQDDVGDRIELLASQHGTTPRLIPQRIELTSRESSSRIPEYLKQMGLGYPDPDALDVILATNMISVGVDVGRLGLMAVMGQPPSTSEYIQATSRVGRQDPGLVVALYNASRSRDRSHYEGFTAYHASIYRQVESTSVTPFAPRARDRGLHAVVVALARQLDPVFNPNTGATAILDHRNRLGPIRELIVLRVKEVSPSEADAVAAEIDSFLDHWSSRAAREPGLVYSNPQHPEISLLGDAASARAWANTDEPVGTLWSLRDVDQSSHLYLI